MIKKDSLAMRRTRLVYDGLWRCLCPAIDKSTLLEAVRRPVLHTTTHLRTRQASRRDLIQNRRFGLDALTNADPSRAVDKLSHAADNDERQSATSLDEVLLAPSTPTELELSGIPTDQLKQALRRIRAPEGYTVHPGQEFDRHTRIIQIVEHLIKKRDASADLFAYECMMDAMIDPRGSARAIRALLKNMEDQGISPSVTICQSALAALAVHPDYALRQQVLDAMQAFWFTVDMAATQNVMLGMLRDGQYELAYDKFMGLLEQGERVDLWVYDIFVMVFGHNGFLDEMLQLLSRRKQARGSDTGAMNLLYYALDICSSASHYQGTQFAWNALVRNGTVNPSDGMLENILATAACEGDVDLATEVHSLISSRSRVQIHHYEALIEAFARVRDIAGALRVVCIMEKNGLPARRENTRSIYEALLKDKAVISSAEAMIREMAIDDTVPLGAISVVLEAIAKNQSSAEALELYRDAKRLSGQEPNAVMIQDMIINSRNWDHSRSFLQDYKDKIPADERPPSRLPMAYNKLISTCLDFKELDLAFRFADRSLFQGPSKDINPVWLRKLTELAIDAEDGRIWKLFDAFKGVGNQDAVSSIRRQARFMRSAKRATVRKQKMASEPGVNLSG